MSPCVPESIITVGRSAYCVAKVYLRTTIIVLVSGQQYIMHRAGVRSIIILMPIMGVTWIFGVFSVSEDTVVFQYLFALFNSVQGVLIFVFHCVLNKKIQTAFRKKMSRWQSLRSYDVHKSFTHSTKSSRLHDESTSAM